MEDKEMKAEELRNSNDIRNMEDYKTGDNIMFIFTFEQQKKVCEYFGKDIGNMEDYEIDELLDKVIDDLNC